MSFLRPEALFALSRWREMLIGATIGGLGLWWATHETGAYFAAGLVVSTIGAALMFTGFRHAMFRQDGEAPGIVEVTEGRITYMGPVMGGSVALAELREITFRRTPAGEAFWRFSAVDGQPLIIPAGAQGVEQLLDACTALPRFDTKALVRAVQSRTPASLTIWRHPRQRALT